MPTVGTFGPPVFLRLLSSFVVLVTSSALLPYGRLLYPALSMSATGSFEHLLPPSWKPLVTAWLAEDTPSFDYGGYVVGEVHREAFLFGKGKQVAVLAGSPFFTEVFTQLGCQCVCIYIR